MLTQAVLPHPMLGARWRWNLNRALVLPRMNGGKRRPIHLQRMEADDLLAAVWPGLAACQENAPPGPVGVPDHVLARQTVDDCLHEGLSVEGLVDVWSQDRVGRDRGAHGRVVGAVALLARHPERPPLHLSRRRAARGAAHPGAVAAPRPGPARPRRAPGAGRRAGGARPRRGRRGARPGPPAAARPRRAARPAALAGGGPARRGVGRTGSTRWPPTAGPASSTAAGWPPSAATRRASLGDRRRGGRGLRRPATSQLAGPVTVEQLVADAPLPAGAPRGRAADRGPGPHGAGPPRGQGLGHRAARRPLVRPQPAGAPARRQPQPAPRPGRGRADRRLRALPDALAARDARQPARGPGRAARGARAAGRGSRRRRRSGRRRSSRPGSPATTRAGSTSCASPARWSGAASPRAPSGPGAAATPSPATPLAFVRARRPR